jgi:hypothetical protein
MGNMKTLLKTLSVFTKTLKYQNTIHTLKLRGQTRLSWREVRGRRIRVRVKHKTGASREEDVSSWEQFLDSAYD